jgi:GT2 family glycosyltransferase
MAHRTSVIIPTYNGASRIGECLKSLAAQEPLAPDEVIVVDDGSTQDVSAVVAGFAGVRLIRQANAGPAAARNNGVRNASGDIILFIDDDCVPAPDWLSRMVEPFADPEIAGCKGAYLTRQTSLTARFVQVEYEQKYDRLSRKRFIDFVDTYSAAFRRDVFLEAGGFDERFTTASAEDQELSFRLANAGRQLVFVPAARVWHTHVSSVRQYARKKRKNGYWKIMVVLKNPNKLAGDDHTPLSQKLQVGLALVWPLSLPALAWWPWGLAAPVGLATLFAASSIGLTARCFRRDKPVALIAPLLIALRAGCLAWGMVAGWLCRRKMLAGR